MFKIEAEIILFLYYKNNNNTAHWHWKEKKHNLEYKIVSAMFCLKCPRTVEFYPSTLSLCS